MEPEALIKILKLSAEQGDHFAAQLIDQLTERGAIIADLERLQSRIIARQAATAAIVTEAAMILAETKGARQHAEMLGLQGVRLQ